MGSPVQVRRYPRSCKTLLLKQKQEHNQMLRATVTPRRYGKACLVGVKPEDLPFTTNHFMLSGERHEYKLQRTGIYISPLFSRKQSQTFYQSMKKNIILVAALGFTSWAFAQQDTTAKLLQQVVVTANKFPQKQSNTGKVVTVITKEQIEKNNGRTVAQLLNEQAGITIGGALNNLGSVQTVYTRGASSGRTLILLDGVPVNDPGMINNEYDLNLFSLDQVERIEVCRGAQSTLYGSDAVAGVVNIITVKSDVQKPFNIQSTLSAGNYGTLKGSLQVYGKQNKFTYTARYAQLTTSGFSSAFDSTGTKQFDNDAYTGNVANAQILFQATPSLMLKSFVLHSRYKAGIDAGVFTDDKDYTANNSNFITGAGFSWTKNRVRINGTYQYNDGTRHYVNDSLHKTNVWYENNEYYGKTQFVELFGTAELAKNLTLIAGGDYRYWSYNQTYASQSAWGPYNSITPDTSLHQKAVYASLLFKALNEKLNLELGGRANWHSRYGNNNTFTFNPSYSFNEQWRVFGSVSSGFKAPSIFQLSMNKDLQPETSVNYEGGVSFQHKKIGSRLVYFNRAIDNGIDYNYTTFNYFNYIHQNVQGIEWEINAQPIDILSIRANYTYLSPEEINQNRVTNKDTITYNYLLRRPAHNLNLTLGVQPLKSVYAALRAKYVSGRYDIGGYMKPDVFLDAYFLLGAHAEYAHNPHVKFFADAQNITNKQFFDVRGYNALPFLVTGGVTFSW